MAEPIDYGQRVDGPQGVGPVASRKPKENRDGRVHPRNPLIGLGFAALALTAAGASVVVFVSLFDRAIGGEMYGQRSEALVLIGPFLFFGVGIPTLIRGLLGIAPWVAYRARVPLEQRRRDRAWDLRTQHLAPLYLFGIPALGGALLFTVVFVGSLFTGANTATGLAMVLEWAAGLHLVASACLGLAAQVHWYRRFFVDYGSAPAPAPPPAP